MWPLLYILAFFLIRLFFVFYNTLKCVKTFVACKLYKKKLRAGFGWQAWFAASTQTRPGAPGVCGASLASSIL